MKLERSWIIGWLLVMIMGNELVLVGLMTAWTSRWTGNRGNTIATWAGQHEHAHPSLMTPHIHDRISRTRHTRRKPHRSWKKARPRTKIPTHRPRCRCRAPCGPGPAARDGSTFGVGDGTPQLQDGSGGAVRADGCVNHRNCCRLRRNCDKRVTPRLGGREARWRGK